MKRQENPNKQEATSSLHSSHISPRETAGNYISTFYGML